MSRSSFIICHLAFIPLLISCSLEENPRDQIEEEIAYTSVSTLFQHSVATLYNYIGGYSVGSDEAMLPTRGADWYDGGIWQDMYRHSWGPGDGISKNAWLYLYKVITLCNHSLEKLYEHEDILGDQRLAIYKSEVQALRAIFYWYLLDLFGNVPIITTSETSMNDVKQASRKEVFDFVEKELRHACSFLPMKKSNRTRNPACSLLRPCQAVAQCRGLFRHAQMERLHRILRQA